MDEQKKYITIDIGGTAIKYGLIDENGVISEKHSIPTEAWNGGPGIVRKVLGIISEVGKETAGVCIASAGMVDTERGRIFGAGPTIPDYADTEYKSVIENQYGLPCEVENDVNCAGLAESELGAARGRKSVLCLTVGTGIGGCFVHCGNVWHGSSGSGCEIGYMHMEGGSFESLASASTLSENVERRKYLQEHTKLDAEEETSEKLSSRNTANIWNGVRIFDSAKAGDTICQEEIDRMCDRLGIGIANICYVLNPEIVVLGGGVMSQKEYMYPRIRKAVDRYLVSSIAENTQLAMAELGNDAGMTGAFLHFLQKQNQTDILENLKR